jgi:hypothetical protein
LAAAALWLAMQITATVRHADSDIDHLHDKRIERTGRHHGSKTVPCPTQGLLIIGKILPKIIDVAELSSGFDLVIYGLNYVASFVVFDCFWGEAFFVS